MNDFYYYKSMDWYELLGFDKNEENKKWRRREYWSTGEIEKNYQNCLSLLNRGNLSEINTFYQKQLPSGKLENLSELRKKIQFAYDTLINPVKRKEYDFEVFGLFYFTYPADEIADEKFRIKAVSSLEYFLQDKWDEDLGHSYWKNYLTDYWQNWRKIVKTMKYKEEIKFFIDRFHELRMFILKTTVWGREEDKKYQAPNAFELIKQEQERLQNLSKEEWDKEREKNKMSEKDIEWVVDNVKKFLNGETNQNSNPPSDNSPQNSPTLDNKNKVDTNPQSGNHNKVVVVALFLIIIGGLGFFLVKKKK